VLLEQREDAETTSRKAAVAMHLPLRADTKR
jgi:hypothetical protein